MDEEVHNISHRDVRQFRHVQSDWVGQSRTISFWFGPGEGREYGARWSTERYAAHLGLPINGAAGRRGGR